MKLRNLFLLRFDLALQLRDVLGGISGIFHTA
jgi:hypothetical protein